MTIVDKQHGAELVTKKGKVFKFDAAECMLNYTKSIEEQTVELFLTNSYKRPGELLDATRAYYLISEEIPSPMGEYLTAFGEEADAIEARKEHGGTLYSWKELRNRFKP
jgi:copper chaperone NosL